MRVAPGPWDVYILAAQRYHWTPAQVDACDPDFIDELTGAFWPALDAHAKAKDK